jgi:hypothetical protein
MLISPWIKAFTNETSAEFIRQMHPIRIRYGMYSDKNPLLKGVDQLAEKIKLNRRPVAADNIFWQMQELNSGTIISTLNAYRGVRDALTERMFLDIYGSKLLQAFAGLRIHGDYSTGVGRDVARERGIQERIHYLLEQATVGGLPEALVRGMLYIVRGGNGFDEREFGMLKQLCDTSNTLPTMTQPEFKELVREQHEILALDEKSAMEGISRLLDNATDAATQEALSAIHTVIKAHGEFTTEERRRLQKLEEYFVAAHATPHRRATDIQIFSEHR